MGTTKSEYNGIVFKSKKEKECYMLLEKSGLDFYYETEKILLWKGKKPDIPVYSPKKKKSQENTLTLYSGKLSDITYTPDFTVIRKGYKIYFDYKGFPNDVYPYKRKMFIRQLSERNDGIKYMFIEPHTISQMRYAIQLIKEL